VPLEPSWGKGGSDGFQEILSLAGRPRKPQAVWLWLVLPLTAIEILLALVDVKTGNYNPELSMGLFSGIFALLTLIPIIIVYIKRFHEIRLVGAHRPYPGHRGDLAADRPRLSQRHAGAEPVRSTGDGLSSLP
jgi:hypothetical protein